MVWLKVTIRHVVSRIQYKVITLSKILLGTSQHPNLLSTMAIGFAFYELGQ